VWWTTNVVIGDDGGRVGVVFKRYGQEICRAGAKSGRYWPMRGQMAWDGCMGGMAYLGSGEKELRR
jgi:hypothetical protein